MSNPWSKRNPFMSMWLSGANALIMFRPDGTFVVRHVVSGPRKDYTMNTTYTRLA